MKLLQINESLNQGSTGRIAEMIGDLAVEQGWEVVIAHSPRSMNPSQHNNYIIGSAFGVKLHAIQTRLFDNHGLASTSATKKLVKLIKEIQPDIIHLHLVHGYYLNYKVLFEFLAGTNIPIVWTQHDCWAFTGHCPYFDRFDCQKWRNEECKGCKQKGTYPASLLFSAAHSNFWTKLKTFTSVEKRMTLVPVSYWLEGLIGQSFLKNCNIRTIHNGIDMNVFNVAEKSETDGLRHRLGLENKKVIVGCAVPWNERKGYSDFFKLRELLSNYYSIIMIGLNAEQKAETDKAGIIGITRTESQAELAKYYSMADVFINPTYEDNFPTTNLEAMACGTPVITYNTGGSPESVTEETGLVVGRGDVNALKDDIIQVCSKEQNHYTEACRKYAEDNFDAQKVYSKYIELYNELLNK